MSLKHTQYILRMKKQKQRGFTLYELLVTMMIVGVVMTLGIPNLTEYTKNSRMTSAANDIHATFHLARSEAARAKANITICASADPMSADADCDGTFDQGYIVFVDLNNPGAISRDAATESILRAHDAADTGVIIRVANDATFFSFSAAGLGRGDVGGNTALTQVVICDERGNVTAAGGNSAARLFIATPLGRATILRDMDMIDTALGLMGETCP
jgi:type IV fimbrial biogenesis protein FimT